MCVIHMAEDGVRTVYSEFTRTLINDTVRMQILTVTVPLSRISVEITMKRSVMVANTWLLIYLLVCGQYFSFTDGKVRLKAVYMVVENSRFFSSECHREAWKPR